MVRLDVFRLGLVWYGTVWIPAKNWVMVGYGTVRWGAIRYDLVWSGMVRFRFR